MSRGTILRALAVLREQAAAKGLTIEQMTALRTFSIENGRCWKARLRAHWMDASASPILHGLRNSHGPSWLVAFRFP